MTRGIPHGRWIFLMFQSLGKVISLSQLIDHSNAGMSRFRSVHDNPPLISIMVQNYS